MRRISLLLFPVLLALSGCGKPEGDGEPNTPMGDAAPGYSGDFKTFLPGTWCAVEDGAVNRNKKWIFKADGTFVFHTEDPWRAGGKWTVNDRVVMLEYVTMDGLPWNDARAKLQKEAEGGGQAAVAESLGMEWYFDKMPNTWDAMVVDADKKHMLMSRTPVDDKPAENQNADPNAQGGEGGQGMPDMGALMSQMGSSVQLERLK